MPTATEAATEPVTEETTAADSAEVTAKKQKLAKAIDNYMSDNVFYGTLLVGVGDNIYFQNSYGYSNEEKKEKNTNDTIYEIGSVTKQFTATAIMMLAEQGKLSLDDKLSKYYSQIDFAKDVTIKQMLTMQSGIPDYLDDALWEVQLGDIPIDDEYTKEDFLETMGKRELEFIPEEGWRYSNSNYYFLGMIIEDVSGMSYEDFIEENIFLPLKMKSSSLDLKNATATGYLCENEPGIRVKSSYFYSAGEIVSTAQDLFKWTDAFINNKLVSESSTKQILKDCGNYYGYGWFVDNGYCFHTGNTVDFYSIDIIEYDHDIKVIALSNYDDKNVANIGKEILSIAQKEVFDYSVPTQTEPTEAAE